MLLKSRMARGISPALFFAEKTGDIQAGICYIFIGTHRKRKGARHERL